MYGRQEPAASAVPPYDRMGRFVQFVVVFKHSGDDPEIAAALPQRGGGKGFQKAYLNTPGRPVQRCSRGRPQLELCRLPYQRTRFWSCQQGPCMPGQVQQVMRDVVFKVSGGRRGRGAAPAPTSLRNTLLGRYSR